MHGRTSGRVVADERAADVKSGPIGSRVTVAEGDGVAEYRGLHRVGSD